MTEIKLRKAEPVERALRRLKKVLMREQTESVASGQGREQSAFGGS